MKRLRHLAVAVVILLLGWLVFRSIGPKEPSYQGRTLSEWFNDHWNTYDYGPSDSFNRDKLKTAEHAVKEIGTNAIPFFLAWVEAKDSPLKHKINVLLERQTVIHFRFEMGSQRRSKGESGFILLGTNAISAVPRLELMMQSPDSIQRLNGMYCLFLIDDAKGALLPIFIKALSNPDKRISRMAAERLQYSYPEAAEKAGVYKMFPDLNPVATNTTATNSPASQ